MNSTLIPNFHLRLSRKCLLKAADPVHRAHLRFLEVLCDPRQRTAPQSTEFSRSRTAPQPASSQRITRSS